MSNATLIYIFLNIIPTLHTLGIFTALIAALVGFMSFGLSLNGELSEKDKPRARMAGGILIFVILPIGLLLAILCPNYYTMVNILDAYLGG